MTATFTGSVPVATGAFPVVSVLTGTMPVVQVTGFQASPVWVTQSGGGGSVSVNNSPTVTATFTGSVPVSTGTFPTVTVTSTVANPMTVSGTVTLVGGMITATFSSSVGSPLWVTQSGGGSSVTVANTASVTSSAANPVWVTGSTGGSANVAVTSSVPITATFTGSVPVNTGTFPVVSVTSTVANPMTVSGTVTMIGGNLNVTSSAASPVWVTQSGGGSSVTVANTASVTSSAANPVWVTGSTGGSANVAVTSSVPITATFTGSVPVVDGGASLTVDSAAGALGVSGTVTATFTGSVPVNTGTMPVVSVTSTSANPVWITSSGGGSAVTVTNTASVTSSAANPVWVTGTVFFSASTLTVTSSNTYPVYVQVTAAMPVTNDAGASLSVDSKLGSLGVTGSTTPAEGLANPTNGINDVAYQMTWNGTTWDRQRSVLGGALVTVQSNYGSTGTITNGPTNPWLIFDSGRAGVSLDKTLFYDQASGTSINALLWTTGTSGITSAVTVANSVITLSGSAVSGTFAQIVSISPISMVGRYPWRVSSLIQVTGSTTTNFVPSGTTAIFGWCDSGTTGFASPQNGAFFRWRYYSGAPLLEGVVTNNGVEFVTFPNFTVPSDGGFHNFEIVPYQDRCRFFVDGVQQAVDPGAGFPMIVGVQKLPLVARTYTTGVSAPPTASVMKVGEVFALQAGAAQDIPGYEQVLVKGFGADTHPSTYAQAQTGSNSNGPTLAVLSNTAASYTSLGGTWRVSGTTGSETDYCFFAYQQPSMHDFVVTGVDIDGYNFGVAQTNLSATVLEWSLGLNATQASLATADALPNVVAPRRSYLGAMCFTSSTFVGVPALNGEIHVDFAAAPRVCRANRFLHIILKIPVGVNTANVQFRGGVTVRGYHR